MGLSIASSRTCSNSTSFREIWWASRSIFSCAPAISLETCFKTWGTLASVSVSWTTNAWASFTSFCACPSFCCACTNTVSSFWMGCLAFLNSLPAISTSNCWAAILFSWFFIAERTCWSDSVAWRTFSSSKVTTASATATSFSVLPMELRLESWILVSVICRFASAASRPDLATLYSDWAWFKRKRWSSTLFSAFNNCSFKIFTSIKLVSIPITSVYCWSAVSFWAISSAWALCPAKPEKRVVAETPVVKTDFPIFLPIANTTKSFSYLFSLHFRIPHFVTNN